MNCRGVLCGAGFETPSEALYLKKKLLVIPMKNQYEQQCNAMALKEIGVPVIYDFNIKSIKKLKDFTNNIQLLQNDQTIQLKIDNIFIPEIGDIALSRETQITLSGKDILENNF